MEFYGRKQDTMLLHLTKDCSAENGWIPIAEPQLMET